MPTLDKNSKLSILDPRVTLALLTLAVGASGTALGVSLSGDAPTRDAQLASLGEALARGSATVRPQRADNLDTRALHDVSRAIRDADPSLVDLGGQLVQPGAETVAGGNLSRGSRLVAWADGCGKLGGAYDAAAMACVLGPASAQWAVLGSSCEDRDESTWCEVRLKNGASDAQRVLVWIRAEVKP